MKALFRFISFLFLIAAMAVGVFDSIRSVSTSSVDLLSVGEGWQQLLPASLAMAEASVAHYIHPEAWRWIDNGLSIIPAFAVLLGFSLLFWMAGYKQRRKMGLSLA
ncbi:hypothetical protein G6L28_00340 [Agrobacterium larrymoorei]|uniref:hypothetical protein n=1 Tax=Agrobacterium larrymoorei TaxID=160699 RepID=UPI001573B1BE|nr:hypothetical protein [Agrobacterium larrymoorei]